LSHKIKCYQPAKFTLFCADPGFGSAERLENPHVSALLPRHQSTSVEKEAYGSKSFEDSWLLSNIKVINTENAVKNGAQLRMKMHKPLWLQEVTAHHHHHTLGGC
jgi:hypothetical protein